MIESNGHVGWWWRDATTLDELREKLDGPLGDALRSQIRPAEREHLARCEKELEEVTARVERSRAILALVQD